MNNINKINYEIESNNKKIISESYNYQDNNKIAGELYFIADDNRSRHCILINSRLNHNNQEENTPFPGWFLQVVGEQLSFAFGNGKTWVSVKSNVVIKNNYMHHVIFSIDNDRQIAELYVDGEYSKLEDIYFKKSCNHVIVGSLSNTGNFYFSGEILDLKLGNDLNYDAINNQQNNADNIDDDADNELDDITENELEDDDFGEIILERIKQKLEKIDDNLDNLDNDILMLKDVISKIEIWKNKGLEIDVLLLEKQLKFLEEEKQKFLEKIENKICDLIEFSNNIKPNDNLLNNNEKNTQKCILCINNLIEDFNILYDVKVKLKEFNNIGVKLGNAFDIIDEQKIDIINTLSNTEKFLEDLESHIFEIKDIIKE